MARLYYRCEGATMKQFRLALQITLASFIFLGITLFFLWQSTPSLIEAASPKQDWTPPNTTGAHLRMRRLGSNGESLGTDCDVGDLNYGCTAFCSNPSLCPSPVRPYPYPSAWPDISFNRDYLLDVVTQETSPGVFDQTALQAQVIAARSYAWYQINNWPGGVINNSTGFQVFLPFKFESFGNGADPNNPADPCHSTNLSAAQANLCATVLATGNHYAAYSLNGIRNQTEIALRVDVEDQAGNVQEALGGTRTIVIHDDPLTISLDTANGNAWNRR